jgi:hypothetical protein
MYCLHQIYEKCTEIVSLYALFCATNLWVDIHNFRYCCCHLYSSCSIVIEWYVIVLTYLGRQCSKFHEPGWTCWFLMSFVWSRVCDFTMDPIKTENDQILCKSRRSATETLAIIKQAFGEYTSVWMKWSVQGRQDRWRAMSRAQS